MTYTKGKSVMLSRNFSSLEFDCHGTGCCDSTKIDPKLVDYLQKIRDYFKSPITITSGYRCPTHNKSVNGATSSRHTKGQAADIVVKGVAPAEVAKYAESIGILGIGLYEAKDGNFVHIDTRTTKSFWYGHAQKYRSTFGGSVANSSNNTSDATAPTVVLKRGSSGEVVRDLQNKLIALGYSCGEYGADGDFGAATESAVRIFQKKMNLVIDGIAGNKTFASLDDIYNATKFKITASVLNVRAGAGTNYKVITTVCKDSIHELSEKKNGWGKLKNLAGWISLDYCEKV